MSCQILEATKQKGQGSLHCLYVAVSLLRFIYCIINQPIEKELKRRRIVKNEIWKIVRFSQLFFYLEVLNPAEDESSSPSADDELFKVFI